jgi:hypothetical protein
MRPARGFCRTCPKEVASKRRRPTLPAKAEREIITLGRRATSQKFSETRVVADTDIALSTSVTSKRPDAFLGGKDVDREN